VYATDIANTLPPGQYNMFLVVRDAEGNITTEQVADMHVLHPFQALNAITKQPIEDVRIVLYRLSQGIYTLVTDTGLKNPLYTNRYGTTEEQLVTGKYKATFSRIGYAQTTKYFSIGISPQDDYPTVLMQPQPITLLRIFTYYTNALIDWRSLNASYFASIQSSYRFFDLVTLVVIISSIILVFLLFSIKTHVALSHISWYLHHHSLRMTGREETPYLSGKILSQVNGNGIDHARVLIFNAATKQLIKEITTNKNGAFLFPRKDHVEYMLSIIKEGFVASEHMLYQPNTTITLQEQTPGIRIAHSPITLLQDTCILAFEFILVFSFILLLVFLPAFDLIKTLPFLITSVINLFLWFFYLWEKRS
ncbi:MAG: carboxypeptidase regulatory-like domain-containing protein, partial [Patescibacteria group bacterium]|nr:carboxypeptidase regulatory-like domain-containing protein [Patescibacteria group bacterium]